jgi:ATP-binding cassette subfamily C protein PrsD
MSSGQHAEPPRNITALALRLAGGRRPFIDAALCTAGINVLALTGPTYMLLLYDRVLPSHGSGQLLALTLLMLLFYSLSACIDLMRQGVLARAARRVDRRLSAHVVKLMHPHTVDSGGPGDGLKAVRDLDHIRIFLSGQAPSALFDLPWMPLYLGVMLLLHPLLGLLATVGAMMLGACAVIAERRSTRPARAAAQTSARRWALAAALRRDAPTGKVTEFSGPLRRHWFVLNERLRDEQHAAARPTIVAAVVLRALRPALQSATLGLGAYLVMTGACHPASMLAASILLSRALGPLETAIAHWRSMTSALDSALQLFELQTRSPLQSAWQGPHAAADAQVPRNGRMRVVLRLRSA